MTLSRFNKRSLLCFCIFLVAIFSATCGFSQSRIEGEVTGDNGQPVPFANILLMNTSDSTLAKGVVTNADGKFIMEDVKSGNFFIVSTMVGYKKTTLPALDLPSEKYKSKTVGFDGRNCTA